MRKTLTLCALLFLAGPAAAGAQEEAPAPPIIVLSSFQCDWTAIGDIVSEFAAQVPIWEQLKADGAMMDAGTYVHAWADEWNVGRYIIAGNMEEAVAANSAANEAFAEENPDANVFATACPVHRDNFYLASSATDDSSAPTGGAPTLVFSMYKCDTNQIGAVLDEYEEFGLPVYQQLVDDGQLRGAGSFSHIWADEWNVGNYFIAESIQSFIDAMDASGPMFAEGSSAVSDAACSMHKDNFYTMGPRTGAGDESGN